MQIAMPKAVYNIYYKKKNRDLISLMKSRLSDLKDEIKEMSEDEIKM